MATRFKDFDGDTIDFQSERNDFLDDQAREVYMEDPHPLMVKTRWVWVQNFL